MYRLKKFINERKALIAIEPYSVIRYNETFSICVINYFDELKAM